MGKVRRTKIVVETQRLLVLRNGRGAVCWCEGCGAAVRMLGLDEAAVVAECSQRELVRRVEAGALHLRESAGGRLLICLNSLLGRARAEGAGDRV